MKSLLIAKAVKATVLWGIVLVILLVSGCAMSKSERTFNTKLARQKLDEALARAVTDENGKIYRNAVIRVELPDHNFVYTGAAGIARADTREEMTADHQFTIASVGKTMTAVVILQLWEEGALGEKGLDATLEDLNAFPPDVLEALHKIDGVSYGRRITVRQLLNQTTGLKDVLMDDEGGIGEDYPKEYRGYAPGSLNGLIVFDKQKGFEAMMHCTWDNIPEGCNPNDYYLSYTWPHWDYQSWKANPSDKMAGLLNFYLAGMNETALWEPGTAFHYADTNYIILGLLIEKLTGNSLHQELRTRIFDPLGMDHSYLAYSIDPLTGPWEFRHSDHWGMNTPIISSGVNLSNDWGAGGEVSTVQDLTVFIRALANNELFDHDNTLAEMVSLPQTIDKPFYAFGIIALPTDDGLILHHNGAPCSWIEYHTALGLSIVGTINDLDGTDRFMTLRADIYFALEEAGLKSANFKTGHASMGLLTTLSGEPSGVFLTVLAVSLLVFLSALATWPVFLLRRHTQEMLSRFSQIAGWLAIGTVALDLLFLVIFVFAVEHNPVQLMFGFNSFMLPILLLPLLSIISTLGLIILAILAWKNGVWSVIKRGHYTLVALSALGFLWILNGLHLFTLP
ncbi:MAG TPA: serine hydrolase domain-containing protein [Anaerolineales bacterium]|nr:serine hydrolase domain-containing protein [Anaerolineales bacterium]